MNLSKPYAYLVFFLVPSLLLLCAALATKRRLLDGVLAFIAGGDNRLSLARSQALAWTLVIFGSFAAAMTIHPKILSDSAKVKEKAEATAKAAAINKADADKDVISAETTMKALAADATDESKIAARKKVDEEKAKAKAAADTLATANRNAAEAADRLVKFDWVIIPAELLMLAGIAIGSGIFSSLISAVNSEDKTAALTTVGGLSLLNGVEANEAGLPATAKPLVIRGKNLGANGKVRLGWGMMGKKFAQELVWKSDGSLIVVNLPPTQDGAPDFSTIVVDTTNGKLSYKISWNNQTQTYALDEQRQYYEFADLFRDDKNPANFDLMKFQMFGWTVVAIFIYSFLFLSDLRPDLTSLPIVPQSIVLLTGLSQAGYLTSKGISNLGSK